MSDAKQKYGLGVEHGAAGCRAKRPGVTASIRGLTQLHNSPAMCKTCHKHATCLQKRTDSIEWEWHCDDCCTHDQVPGDVVCIAAQTVPMHFTEGGELSSTQAQEFDEAIRIIGRLTGMDMSARIKSRVKNAMASRICLWCSGSGRIRSRFLIWTRPCHRCDAEGEVLVSTKDDEEA